MLQIKRSVSALVPSDSRVLEIGCGAGGLAFMCLDRGAVVDGFDLNPKMVDVVRKRIASGHLENKLHVQQMGVDGMDKFPGSTYDVVVSTLALSELSDDERRYALKHAFRVLRPGGRIVIADEVVPRTAGRRILYKLIRMPMLMVTFLVSGDATRPVSELSKELTAAGFTLKNEARSQGDAFAIVLGLKPTAETINESH